MTSPLRLAPLLLLVLAGVARADELPALAGRWELDGRVSSGARTRVIVETESVGGQLVVHRTVWIGSEEPTSCTTSDLVRLPGGAIVGRFRRSPGLAGQLQGDAAAVVSVRWAVGGDRIVETIAADGGWRSQALGRRLRPEESPCRARSLVVHGDPTERYDLVFVAEGYRAHELRSFRESVDEALAQLRATTPYREYWGYLNVHVVELASARSGIQPGPGNLGTRLGRTPKPDRARATAAARAATPDPDCVVVVANEWFRSLAVRGLTVVSAGEGARFPTVVVHELGHSLGLLLDEYDELAERPWDLLLASRPTKGLISFAGWGANIAVRKDDLPWRAWLTAGAPLPTPVGSGVAVGMYEGGLWLKRGFYRPSEACLMRDMSSPLCPPCREAVVLRLSQRTFPLRLETRRLDDGAWKLTVVSSIPGPARFRWTRDGKPLAEDGPTLVARHGAAAWSEVRVEVQDATPWVRADPRRWTTHAVSVALVRGPGARPALVGPKRDVRGTPTGEQVAARLERLAGF